MSELKVNIDSLAVDAGGALEDRQRLSELTTVEFQHILAQRGWPSGLAAVAAARIDIPGTVLFSDAANEPMARTIAHALYRALDRS